MSTERGFTCTACGTGWICSTATGVEPSKRAPKCHCGGKGRWLDEPQGEQLPLFD